MDGRVPPSAGRFCPPAPGPPGGAHFFCPPPTRAAGTSKPRPAVVGVAEGRLSRDFASALERSAQGELVGVLQVAADRQAAGDAGHPHAEGLEQPAEVHGGRLALEVRVRAEDDLGDALGLEARQQLPHPELVGADPLDRADGSLEDVVAAPELAGALHGDDVARLLDDAEHGRVAAVVGADAALVSPVGTAMLKHRRQNPTRSFTSAMACASRRASSF